MTETVAEVCPTCGGHYFLDKGGIACTPEEPAESHALLDRIETLAANNLTGCGTCTSIIDEIRRAAKASGTTLVPQRNGFKDGSTVHPDDEANI